MTSKIEKLPCGKPTPRVKSPDSKTLRKIKEHLREFLEKEGLKQSDQRWIIAEMILVSPRHLSAQEIVKMVQESHPKIGVATVYRNLKILSEAKIIRESLLDSQGTTVYEAFEEDHHDHVVCIDCGQIFEFHNERLENLQNQILEGLEFRQVSHRHVLYGKCQFKKK